MKKKTSTLAEKIKAYSILAGTFIAITPNAADAQINYTDVNPDFSDSDNGASYSLDLNNDGMTDFVISVSSDGLDKVILKADALTGNAIAGTYSSAYQYPTALYANDIIGVDRTWNMGAAQIMASSGYYMNPYGHWFGVTDRYVGLRLDSEGSPHYGWVRLDASADGHSFTVKDYAYQTVSDLQIYAGYSCFVLPIEPTIVLNGSSLFCNESADLYQWYLNDSAIDGATNQAYTPAQEGKYSVKVTNMYGCTNISAYFNYVLNDVAVVDNASIKIYESGNSLHLQLTDRKFLGAELKIFNSIGEEVFSNRLNAESTQFDLNHFARGLYAINIIQNGSRLTSKIVIK